MPRTRAEIGATGLPLFRGTLALDPNRRLRGAAGVKIYREMAHDEPAASAFLAACYNLLRTDLDVSPGGSTDRDKKAAEFLRTCLDDMRDSIGTMLRQMYSMIWAGWGVHELVYKRRSGGNGSRYTDGLVGWAAWGLRRQETLYQWNTDKNGRISAFQQRPAPDYVLRTIPLTKCVHIVADDSEGSPEGRSMLRGMYVPLYFVKNIRLLYGISLERFGTGVPVFEIAEGRPELTPENRAALEKIAASLRQNEEAYVITPADITFRFAESPGLDADNYKEALQFFQVWALAAGLADFVALGTGNVGSFALGKDKSELFLLALNGYQDRVLNALNRQAVPRLFRYSDFGKLTALPQLTLPAVRRYDLEQLAHFSEILHRIGAFHPTPEDEAHLRKISDLIDLDEKTLKMLHDADDQEEERPEPVTEGDTETGQDASKVENADEEGTDEKEVAVSDDEEVYA